MNRKKSQADSISKPALADAIGLHEANLQAVMPKPAGPPSLAPSRKQAAELDQDPGGSFNPSHTYPQS
jgi:hypothetical protein